MTSIPTIERVDWRLGVVLMASMTGAADTVPAIRALVQTAAVAVDTIKVYNNVNGSVPAALIGAQYDAAGVAEVNADSAWAIQGLVAQRRQQAFAEDEATLVSGQAFLPQTRHDLDAYVAGVADNNLELVSRLRGASNGADTETHGEIRHLVNSQLGTPANTVTIDRREANGVVICDCGVAGNDTAPDVVLDVRSAMVCNEEQLRVDGQQVLDHIQTSAELAAGEEAYVKFILLFETDKFDDSYPRGGKDDRSRPLEYSECQK